MHLLHVTITKNQALVSSGGVHLNHSVTLENSIVAGNISPANPEINTTVTHVGTNFTSGDPVLAALGDFGGFAQTMPPLPGSPVIEGTASTPYQLDQRGAVRPSGPLPDIGAVEAFPFSSLTLVDTDNDQIDDRIELSYTRYTVGLDDSALDTDGDGSTDAEEFANMSDPDDAVSYLEIVSFVPADGFSYPSNIVFDVTWTTFPGLNYTIESDDALNFGNADILGPIIAEGFTRSATVSFDNTNQDFIRIRRN